MTEHGTTPTPNPPAQQPYMAPTQWPVSPPSGSEETRSDSEDLLEHHPTAIFPSPPALPHLQTHPSLAQHSLHPQSRYQQHNPSSLPTLADSAIGSTYPPQPMRARSPVPLNSSTAASPSSSIPHTAGRVSPPLPSPSSLVSSSSQVSSPDDSQISITKAPKAKRAKLEEVPGSEDPTTVGSSATPSRVRRSAALAARAIKVEMMDSFEPAQDDDDGDALPGGSNRKRKRGEQQKAKHNVAEKRRRVEMNDAMDRIKACLSQGQDESRVAGSATKVSVLLETADHLENLQSENDRLKQHIHSLSTRVQLLEQEVAHYRGESTDDNTSLVSSPGTDSRSPRSRLAVSLTSATLLTILFCIVWTPAQDLVSSHMPATFALSRAILERAEASSYEFIWRFIHLITANVLPTISFFISLLYTLYLYSALVRPIIRDKDLIAAHLETITAIHGARVHSGKTAWMKALKLSSELGIKPPSPLMSVPHIVYEILRWVAVNLWFGVFSERAIYFLRGVSPDELDKNSELEVSVIQCLVELCPDADWSIAAVMIRALNICAIAPNRRFVNGESVVPLYKVKLWAFGAQRLLTHFSWPYRLLAWYCARRMTKFRQRNEDKQHLLSQKEAQLQLQLQQQQQQAVVELPAAISRARNRTSSSPETPESILGKHESTTNDDGCTIGGDTSGTNDFEADKGADKNNINGNSNSNSNHKSSSNKATTATDNEKDVRASLARSASSPAISTTPTYVVSTQDDAALFNVMMPENGTGETSAPSNANGVSTNATAVLPVNNSSRRVESSYRSVCLVHEIAAHMLAGRMSTADSALAELIALRSQAIPNVSRVTTESLHATHIIPFTRWGTLRTQLLRALVQGIQGKYSEAVKIALFVQQEAEANGDVETRCASVLLSTHLLLLAGHTESAASQLSSLLMDGKAVSCLMSDNQQYSALRAMWILLEVRDSTRDRVVDGVDFVVDERFIVELRHFVNGLEMRRDHRFETLYYLLCVTEAALDAWQRMDEVISEYGKTSLSSSAELLNPTLVNAQSPHVMLNSKRAMLLEQRSSCFLNLKLLTRRALDLLGHASGTGVFFSPGYHFLSAKLILLSSNQSASLPRVEKELSISLSSCWQLGRWSKDSLEQSIEDLHHELMRPLIQVEDETNTNDADLDEPPTARTCS